MRIREIEALGYRGYGRRYEFTHTVPAILAEYGAKTAEELVPEVRVRIAGRLMTLRHMGKAGVGHVQKNAPCSFPPRRCPCGTWGPSPYAPTRYASWPGSGSPCGWASGDGLPAEARPESWRRYRCGWCRSESLAAGSTTSSPTPSSTSRRAGTRGTRSRSEMVAWASGVRFCSAGSAP